MKAGLNDMHMYIFGGGGCKGGICTESTGGGGGVTIHDCQGFNWKL